MWGGGYSLFKQNQISPKNEPISAEIITQTTNPLFNSTASGGERNETLRRQLLDLAALAKPTTPMTANGEWFYFATARDIATANGTVNAPVVKLFETITNSFYTSFLRQSYRLVAITFPIGGEPVFTFYSTSVAMFSKWESVGTNYVKDYSSNSDIPVTLNNAFNGALAWFPSYITEYFKTPQIWQISPTWWFNGSPQFSFAVGGNNAVHNNLYDARWDDKIWIPSAFEVCVGAKAGAWDLNDTERGYTVPYEFSGDGANTAWLRSTTDSLYSASSNAYVVTTNGVVITYNVTREFHIRPALHLSFPATDPTVDPADRADAKLKYSTGATVDFVWMNNAVTQKMYINAFKSCMFTDDTFECEVFDGYEAVTESIGGYSYTYYRQVRKRQSLIIDDAPPDEWRTISGAYLKGILLESQGGGGGATAIDEILFGVPEELRDDAREQILQNAKKGDISSFADTIPLDLFEYRLWYMDDLLDYEINQLGVCFPHQWICLELRSMSGLYKSRDNAPVICDNPLNLFASPVDAPPRPLPIVVFR